ncbi:MAG: hypothetical protein AB8H80_21985 [Planctomycetota bacterium]
MHRILLTYLFVAAAGALAAQARPDSFVVVAEHSSGPRTRLVEVERVSGAVRPIVPLPASTWPARAPVALAVDRASRDVVLASFDPALAQSQVWRLRLNGVQVAAERLLGSLSGQIVAVVVQANGDVFAAVGGSAAAGGGVYRFVRSGGAPIYEWAADDITSLSENVVLPTKYLVLQTPNGAAQQMTQFLATSAGAPLGSLQLAPPSGGAGAFFTASHEHLNGQFGHPRELLLADSLGGLWLGNLVSGLTPKAITPPIAAGGARRMKARPGPLRDVWILGGAADPTLKMVLEAGPQAQLPVTVLAGPLAGDPVDFGYTGASEASTYAFGDPCAAAAIGAAVGSIGTAGGVPQLGNAQFEVTLTGGETNSLALLALGGLPELLGLPVPPLNCAALVAPQVTVLRTTDAQGSASLPLSIPAQPLLAGAIFSAQWWQFAAPFAPYASDALALHVW